MHGKENAKVASAAASKKCPCVRSGGETVPVCCEMSVRTAGRGDCFRFTAKCPPERSGRAGKSRLIFFDFFLRKWAKKSDFQLNLCALRDIVRLNFILLTKERRAYDLESRHESELGPAAGCAYCAHCRGRRPCRVRTGFSGGRKRRLVRVFPDRAGARRPGFPRHGGTSREGVRVPAPLRFLIGSATQQNNHSP